MKKSVLLSYICLAVSCVPVSLDSNDTDVNVTTLRAVLADSSNTRTEFGLSTTSGSHSQILWKAGDQLRVFSATASDLFYTEQGGETADFISCVAFGRAAEFAEKYYYYW